ncbi:MAG: biotin/lipoyl-binding protein [Planctomycetes bacterium]|nr:biotin/lipoyl-binding protein [Planctomycetota bacterium]
MAVEFKLPDLGENVKSADVVSLMVAVGDTIAKNQPVIEAETDKAVMEIPSSVAGKITAISVKKGDTVKVGQVVLTVDESAAAKPVDKKADRRKEDKKESPAPQPEAPVSSSREAAPAPAPAATPAPAQPAAPVPVSSAQGPVAAAPSVRQFAREIGIDIHQVPGTGPGGRISVEDVKAYARTRAAAGGRAPASDKPRAERQAMTKIRKVTAAHMAKCWNTVPHVTIFDKADVTDLEAERQQFKKKAEQAGGKLTITPMFMKIAAAALKVFPNLNASIDTEKSEIELHHYCNLGVAVDTPRGLVVPVIRDVDKKNIIELALEIGNLSIKARDGKLLPDDMSGGTFTITNLGSIGTGFFTPIVNHPEVAILGMGRAVMEPVWDGKQFIPRLMAPLSLSFDHRLVDGADGARFLRWIVQAVENPLLISLEG